MEIQTELLFPIESENGRTVRAENRGRGAATALESLIQFVCQVADEQRVEPHDV